MFPQLLTVLWLPTVLILVDLLEMVLFVTLLRTLMPRGAVAPLDATTKASRAAAEARARPAGALV